MYVDININNKYWQLYESQSVKMYLYAAYLDKRKLCNGCNGAKIRITAVYEIKV